MRNDAIICAVMEVIQTAEEQGSAMSLDLLKAQLAKYLDQVPEPSEKRPVTVVFASQVNIDCAHVSMSAKAPENRGELGNPI